MENLSVGLAPASSPGRGAFGSKMKWNRLPRPPLVRGGGIAKQWRRGWFPFQYSRFTGFWTHFLEKRTRTERKRRSIQKTRCKYGALVLYWKIQIDAVRRGYKGV